MRTQGVTARFILEIVGTPKDHVEEALKQTIEKLKEDKKLQLLSSKTFETEQLKNKFWSTFAEVEFKAKDMMDVLDACFDYTPSTLEILEPAGIELDTGHLAGMFNDLLAKLHQMIAIIKNLEAENQLMKMELEKKNQ